MLNIPSRNALADYLPHNYYIDATDSDEIDIDVYTEFESVFLKTKNERPIQMFLEAHPKILGALLHGHLGKWIVPQKRLGSQYIPDFIIGDHSSFGMHWFAVELESPIARMFNKNGNPSSQLTHAIRQIQDWRSWLSDNRAYASRKVSRGGLGLYGIRATLPGVIFIGKSEDLEEANQNLRAQMSDELNIRIKTYNWLLRAAAYMSKRS